VTDTLVLCYHAVSRSWPSPLAVTPDQLRSHLERLLRRGYKPVTFEAAVTAPRAPRTLAVTFDDAYRSIHRLAFPILRELGVPATVFAPTDYIGLEAPMAWPGITTWSDGPYRSELIPVDWTELNELADAGWEIGSHSCSHARLTQLTDSALASELHGSRSVCEARTGRECRSIAYPYGDLDDRVAAAAKAAGYVVGAALDRAHVNRGQLQSPRIGVYRIDDDWRFRLKASRPGRGLRSAVWSAARTIGAGVAR
jgi:peptidoglycan/xylan/chitin deacetylase (PgdA/CDA1 family)